MIKIKNKQIGQGKPVFIIAEMACSHDGSMDIAKKIIDAASKAKADAINLQMTNVQDYMVPHFSAGGVSEGKVKEDAESSGESEIYAYLKKLLWFAEKEWKELFEYAREKNLIISVTCNDMESAKLAKKLDADIYQIHSSSLLEENLVREVAKSKKPITLKIGGTLLKEIEQVVEWIKQEGNQEIILLHGYQSYPTKLDDVNLRFIPTLREKFSLEVGFADHTDGGSELALFVPLLSIPFGANFIEKHLTHDRSKKCEDFESALDPKQFKKFVEFVREAEKTFGQANMRDFSEDELKYRDVSKKRVVSAKALKKGAIIKSDDITFKRANTGLLPDQASIFIGKKLKKDVKENHSLEKGDVE